MKHIDYKTIPPDKFLSKSDYDMAMASQSAVNGQALWRHFTVKALSRICATAQDLGEGTDFINQHPLVVLYLTQLVHLAGGYCEWNNSRYSEAYSFAVARALEAPSESEVLGANLGDALEVALVNKNMHACNKTMCAVQWCGSWARVYKMNAPLEEICTFDVDPFPRNIAEVVEDIETKHKVTIVNYDREANRFIL